MRVLTLVSRDAANSSAAGGDVHVTMLSEELARKGNEVTLLTVQDPELPRVERRGNLRIVRAAPPRLLSPVAWGAVLLRSVGRYDLVIEEAIGGDRGVFLTRLLTRAPVITFWYQDNRPLFREALSPAGASVASLLQSVLLRIGRKGWALANSQTTRRWLESQGYRQDRVAVTYPSVDRTEAPATLAGFEERGPTIVTVGNFRPTKRFQEALEMLVAVRASVPEARLKLIGRAQDPRYLARLRRLARELGVRDASEFHVNVSDREKFRLLGGARVLTIHSPIEGFGWTIPEAGLCGVPAVGNPGVPTDTLREGVNGVRVPFGDIAAYARAVTALLTDPVDWRRLSAGAAEVASEFDRSPLTPEVCALLARACGSPSHSTTPSFAS